MEIQVVKFAPSVHGSRSNLRSKGLTGNGDGQVDVPMDVPYDLSGLDTLNPVLTIGDKLKLIGEYEETIGTCLIFSENDKAAVVHEEANLFKGTCTVDSSQSSTKTIKPIASLHKILRFRPLPDADPQGPIEKPVDRLHKGKAAG
ncbi:hypothetical protein Nepgr_016226 [Nepenthes gracilis]|uniref:Transcription factor TFIIIC triple barrel domain-containing protein n=1 Tax=Nepenthes gracilis TaxID=150966 RepID=A0AAD3XSB4_NEPGR|nr:hypothetical protein Nepgr_016226 [Nepenthes gracilis]